MTQIYSNPLNFFDGDTRPGQTHKKSKDLSAREREKCGCGEGGGVYTVCVGDIENRECRVVASVNTTMLSETI